MMSDDNDPPKAGQRKDGKNYKQGNTRADGSYEIGKYRAPADHRFQANDGRSRGRREKGTRNVLTDWREELAEKIVLSEGGKAKKITKRRGVIKTQVDRAMKSSDRAAETVLRYAELSEKRDPGLQANDFEIIEAWFASRLEQGDSDDADYAAAGQTGDLDDVSDVDGPDDEDDRDA